MSNSERGNEFKERVGRYLRREGYAVEPEYAVKVGFPTRGRKKHRDPEALNLERGLALVAEATGPSAAKPPRRRGRRCGMVSRCHP